MIQKASGSGIMETDMKASGKMVKSISKVKKEEIFSL